MLHGDVTEGQEKEGLVGGEGQINEIQNVTRVEDQDTLVYDTLPITLDAARISLVQDTVTRLMIIQAFIQKLVSRFYEKNYNSL